MDPFEVETESELPPPDPRWWDPRRTKSDDANIGGNGLNDESDE
jgi:hypothetical protein